MVEIHPIGDSAFQLTFGNIISENIHWEVSSFCEKLKNAQLNGVIEYVPSYTKVVVHYNPLEVDYKKLLKALKKLDSISSTNTSKSPDIIDIPVLYGEPFGTDMTEVKKCNKLNESEIIFRHTTATYLVYMLGFTPGFCYLGGMHKALSTPRKLNPSNKILAGSVGIAGEQTGIYPMDSPGGWQIIGRTPLKLFDPKRNNIFLVKAGNYIRFHSISKEEFNRLNQYEDGAL